jgi:UDP-glucuronate decarboxylase
MKLTKEFNNIYNAIDGTQLENKKTLIIGSAGFIGRYLVEFFNYFDLKYITMDISDDTISKQHIKFNLCEELKLQESFDFVINCAGIASPVYYMKKPIQTLDVSYLGTKNILDFCNKIEAKSVIMFSSSEVYGTPVVDKIPTNENYVGNIPSMSSRSCYDIGKLVLETLCYNYHLLYGTPIKIIRPFNFYGPYMNPNDKRVLSNWIKQHKNGNKIKIYGNGKQTRTFCYIADGVCGILKAMLDGKNGNVYNIGNPAPELSMTDAAKIVCSYYGLPNNFEIIDYPTDYPHDEPLRRCPDISKSIKELNFNPIYDFEYGFKMMNEYYNFLEDKD